MKTSSLHSFLALSSLYTLLSFSLSAFSSASSGSTKDLKVPDGFIIEKYATVKGARSLVLNDKGNIIFVGTGGFSDVDPEGRVFAVIDSNNDGKADKVTAIAKGLNNPNGVAFHKGDLYIAEINRISKISNIESKLEKVNNPEVIFTDLPSDRSHGWKYIAFGPDGKLYIPVGAPGNVTNTDCDPRKKGKYSRVFTLDLKTKKLEEFAIGIRNTVGFDWHPVTGDFWFTENGRDNLGDNIPPDELNVAPKKGLHFGFPYKYGKNKSDRTGGNNCNKVAKFEPSTVDLGPHVAALGMTFYRGNSFPEKYKNQIFIAEHGSWNRSSKIGYRVSLVTKKPDGQYSYESFASGWLQNNGSVTGRPVDVINSSDGGLYVSGDREGVIYKISYPKKDGK